jgi:elongation factor Ts
MAFTAKDVQALRERTGCGMMDCKKVLVESDGDMDKAVEFLREKGLAAASKKAGRIAAEGLVDAFVDESTKIGVIVEVNSETDFVAKNVEFQALVKTCGVTIAKTNPADVDALLETKADGTDMTIADLVREKILTIGENIKVRRFVRMQGPISTYVHGGGRIGVMVSFDTTDEIAATAGFKELAKDIALQIAAQNAVYLDKASVPSGELEKEKEILMAQAINEGKPANIAEKMVVGRMGKFYKDFCLLEQFFIKNEDVTVSKHIDEKVKELGGAISIKAFVRYEKGEGLQKKEEDFASEVASMIK